MGATIGSDCHIDYIRVNHPDLVQLGDRVVFEAQSVVGHNHESDTSCYLTATRTVVASDCHVGYGGVVVAGANVGPCCSVWPFSVAQGRLPEGNVVINSGSHPRRELLRANFDRDISASIRRPRACNRWAVLGLEIVALGVMLFGRALALAAGVYPALQMIAPAGEDIDWEIRFSEQGYSVFFPLHSVCPTVKQVFLMLVAFGLGMGLALVLMGLLAKWVLLGRVKEGDFALTMQLWWRYLVGQHFMAAGTAVVDLLGPTLAQNLWYKALGMKVSVRTNLSAVKVGIPDMIEVAADAFIGQGPIFPGLSVVADGDQEIVVVRRTVVRARTFVGGSALVMPGAEIQTDAAVGELSHVPMGFTVASRMSFIGFGMQAPFRGTFAWADPWTFIVKTSLGALHALVLVALLAATNITVYLGMVARVQAEAQLWMQEPDEDLVGWVAVADRVLWASASLGAAVTLGVGALAFYGLTVIVVVAVLCGYKWALLGKLRPSEKHPLRGDVHGTWVVLHRIVGLARQLLSPLDDTFVIAVVFRLLGASIGDNVRMSVVNIHTCGLEADSLTLEGDNHVQGIVFAHHFGYGHFTVRPIRFGRGARTVSSHFVLVDPGATVGPGAVVGPCTHALGFSHDPTIGYWQGVPAMSATRDQHGDWRSGDPPTIASLRGIVAPMEPTQPVGWRPVPVREPRCDVPIEMASSDFPLSGDDGRQHNAGMLWSWFNRHSVYISHVTVAVVGVLGAIFSHATLAGTDFPYPVGLSVAQLAAQGALVSGVRVPSASSLSVICGGLLVAAEVILTNVAYREAPVLVVILWRVLLFPVLELFGCLVGIASPGPRVLVTLLSLFVAAVSALNMLPPLSDRAMYSLTGAALCSCILVLVAKHSRLAPNQLFVAVQPTAMLVAACGLVSEGAGPAVALVTLRNSPILWYFPGAVASCCVSAVAMHSSLAHADSEMLIWASSGKVALGLLAGTLVEPAAWHWELSFLLVAVTTLTLVHVALRSEKGSGALYAQVVDLPVSSDGHQLLEARNSRQDLKRSLLPETHRDEHDALDYSSKHIGAASIARLASGVFWIVTALVLVRGFAHLQTTCSDVEAIDHVLDVPLAFAKQCYPTSLGGLNGCWLAMQSVASMQTFGEHPEPIPWGMIQEQLALGGVTPPSSVFRLNPLIRPELCDHPSAPPALTGTLEIRKWVQGLRVLVINETGRAADVQDEIRGALGIVAEVVSWVNLTDPAESLLGQHEGFVMDGFFAGVVDKVRDAERTATHFKALRMGMKGKQDQVLVLEDTASLGHDFASRVAATVQATPCSWQVLSLRSELPYGECMNSFVSRVSPNLNSNSLLCNFGTNFRSVAMLYRRKHIQHVIDAVWPRSWNVATPACQSFDVALASTSRNIQYFAVPGFHHPQLVTL
eukprot:CAMPEP_0204341736 /NCGR_PEP_ID=MMETSP0469-20131031/23579_1 /ASSEMBLY_ACC=CAM_ASM_000384 /TAXON_ID=2969 /ORGANISM="Oxyrrhis marina" /LENGTH=1401 /DNA_ID=CAMNT_0051326507 /DNA_START=248 /DNA_END=4453 /DNA_ORIENTATION=-